MLIGPIFLDHCACQHLFGPPGCTPLNFTFSVYIHGNWTLGKSYGIEPRWYWEHLGEHIWEPLVEHDENHWEPGKKHKKSLSPVPSKKEIQKTGSFMSACWAFPLAAWNFYFQNSTRTLNLVIHGWDSKKTCKKVH